MGIVHCYVSLPEGNPPGQLQDGKGPLLKYEGLMADRRIGGTDRESYVRGTQKRQVSGLSCSADRKREPFTCQIQRQ